MTADSTFSRPLLTVAIAATSRDNISELPGQLSEAGLLHQPDVQICIAYAGEKKWDSDTAIRNISCPDGTPVFQLYKTILEQTDSQYVALLDAACPPAQGWLTAARKQIRESTAIFYGPVEVGWRTDDPRIVGYLVEYAQFRRPLDPTLGEYPGNNIVFRRQLLATAPPDSSGFQKSFFLRRIKKKLGIKPSACDDMVIVYRKSYSWPYYLRKRLSHGRLYGSSHALSLGNRRFVYAGATVLLPLLRYWRIHRATRREVALHKAALRFSARILASECAWSIGEFQGYIAGAADNESYLD